VPEEPIQEELILSEMKIIAASSKSTIDLVLQVFEAVLIVGIGAAVLGVVDPEFGWFETESDRRQWLLFLWSVPVFAAIAVVGLRRLSIPLLVLTLALLGIVGFVGVSYFFDTLPLVLKSALNWWFAALVVAALSAAGFIVLVIGLVTAILSRRNRHWRSVRESSPYGRRGFGRLLNVLGIPMLARAGGARKAIAIPLLLLSAAALGLAIRQAIQLLPEFGVNLDATHLSCRAASASIADTNDAYMCSWVVGQGKLVVMLYLTVGLLAVLVLIAKLLNTAAWRLLRLDAEKQAAKDRRPCVLFLRPFGRPGDDDRVELEDDSLVSARGKANIDQIVTEEFVGIGPTVALAKPGMRQSLSGAARTKCSNENWQETVSRLSGKATCAVLCLGSTPGVKWEVEYLLNSGRHDRVLVLSNPTRRDKEHNELLREALVYLGILEPIALPSLLPVTIGAYCVNGTRVLLLSKSHSVTDYQLAIRDFARSIWEHSPR
jgi:hypothetical protein